MNSQLVLFDDDPGRPSLSASERCDRGEIGAGWLLMGCLFLLLLLF
jgi:hypothetical protein